MTGEELLRKIGEIEDADIELAEGRSNRRARLIKWAAAAAACLALAIGLYAVIRTSKKPIDHHVYQPTPVPTVSEASEPVSTPMATEDANVTEGPTHTPEATGSPTAAPTDIALHFTSQQGDLSAVTGAMLHGDSVEDMPLTVSGSGVYFGFEGDRLVAYAQANVIDEPGSVRYELYDAMEYYPAELGEMAKKSVADYIRRNLQPDFAGDASLQLFGFIGEDYIIFTGEPFHGYEACAIFRKDGGEWREFGANEGFPVQITGGCILSDKVAYLCYFDRSLMRFDDYTPRRLTVCMTEDGGSTWNDIGLWIPEEYEGAIAPPAAALSPSFDGGHGVMPVTYSTYNGDTDSFESHIAWFESTDGGVTWEFRAIPSQQFPTGA